MTDSDQPPRTSMKRRTRMNGRKSSRAGPYRLPMSWNQSDVVFTDEENGVVAFKRRWRSCAS